jgi:hypothetical protein
MIYSVNEIIGKECTYFPDEDESLPMYIEVERTGPSIRCKVTSIELDIEDKFPYNLGVIIGILPINTDGIDDDDIFDMSLGVPINSLVFD